MHEPFLHVMWLQPPFFSIEVPHLGHDFVFDTSLVRVRVRVRVRVGLGLGSGLGLGLELGLG